MRRLWPTARLLHQIKKKILVIILKNEIPPHISYIKKNSVTAVTTMTKEQGHAAL
jgi:hypothetical protein